MFCPKCRCEYVAGIKECPECREPLVEELNQVQNSESELKGYLNQLRFLQLPMLGSWQWSSPSWTGPA